MRATDFEFRFRFFIIVGLFAAAFGFSRFDSVGSAEALARLFRPGSVRNDLVVRGIIGAGGLIVAAGALIRTWATAYLRADVVHDARLHTQALVADGPYRRLRNPLYLGIFLLAGGAGLTMSRLGYAILVGTVSLYLHRLIRREEAELRRTQGDSYAAYCRAVPSFWPALAPRLPPGRATPRWRQAFKGELFVWLYMAAQLAYAVTLDHRVALIFVVAGFCVNALEVYGPEFGRAVRK